MTEQATKPAKRKRSLLTHEERSAATRNKLIESAIYCLRRYGYLATTTIAVAEHAGLSRGAMLHQFGTKVDLMLAVARYVVDQQNSFFASALRRFPRGRDRFVALTDVTWEALSRPSAIALTEIMIASRSDPDLAAQFPAVAEELDRIQSEGVWHIAQTAGITDRETVDAMHRLHRSAMMGLAINLTFMRDASELAPAIRLLHSYKERLADDLIAKAGEGDKGDNRGGAPVQGSRRSKQG